MTSDFRRHFPVGVLEGLLTHRLITVGVFFAALSLISLPGCARKKAIKPVSGVSGLTIERRILLGEGVSFGAAGSYETLTGKVHYVLDPEDERNRRVTDVRFAAGADGLVRYSADIIIVKPTDTARGNGALLYHVVNRGNYERRVLEAGPWAGVASSVCGSTERMGRLMKQGFTMVFSGWQDDVLAENGRLRLYAPEALNNGSPMPGHVLAEIQTDSVVKIAYLGDSGHRAYPVDPMHAAEAGMRVHETHADPGTLIDRESWSFARVNENSRVQPDSVHVYYTQGFEPSRFYTVRYRTHRSPLMSLCFPAVRDLVTFLTSTDTLNPLLEANGECPIRWRLAYGSSQCGRFLRDFLYQGFNSGLDSRRVFDGMLPNVPGCRMGFFNYRHAQPSRAWGFYPNFDFPFTHFPTTDPVTGKTSGILEAVPDSFQPKIACIHHSGEYWSSGAALTHTDVQGIEDIEIPPNVRIYTISGTAHGYAELAGGRPEPAPGYYLPYNPNAAYFIEVPLLEALARWVMFNQPPPPSSYPRIDRDELVAVEMFSFPAVPDVEAPVLVELHPRFEWGERFEQGILDNALPGIGPLYPNLVPVVGLDGNEVAGIRPPHVAVPVASYTGWNYPKDFDGAENTVASRLSGAWLPFCKDRQEKISRGDSRKSLAELYKGRGDYLDRLRRYAEKMVDQGLMLAEDVDLVLEQGGAMYDFVSSQGTWKKDSGFNERAD